MGRRVTKVEISMMSHLAAIARAAGAAIGGSGVARLAEELDLADLKLAASMLSEQFDDFARALNAAIVKLDVPGIPEE